MMTRRLPGGSLPPYSPTEIKPPRVYSSPLPGGAR